MGTLLKVSNMLNRTTTKALREALGALATPVTVVLSVFPPRSAEVLVRSREDARRLLSSPLLLNGRLLDVQRIRFDRQEHHG